VPANRQYDPYPTLTSKLVRRMYDVPEHIACLRDRIVPGNFVRLHEVVKNYTMCGKARLRSLYRAVSYVCEENIPGDLVECGTAKGGSAAMLGLTSQLVSSNRTLWVFDTFEGIPEPTQADPDYEEASKFTGLFRGELHEVADFFDQCGILQNARLVKGLFQETLPFTEVESIAVLHIDADWYESVWTCINCLYDRISPGGVIQFDDYGTWAGARKAIDEFLKENAADSRLRYVDHAGRIWIKPRNARSC
jgi:hypothetical protein